MIDNLAKYPILFIIPHQPNMIRCFVSDKLIVADIRL